MNTLFAAVASSAALSAGLLAQVTSVRMGPPDSAPTAPVQRPPTKPEDLCTLEGRVTNAITGEPLKKATVTIDGREFKMPWAWYTTVSDETGRYAAKGLDPGHYRVSARRSGFLGTPQRGGPPPDGTERLITLTPGQRAADADLKLTPQGVVTGRVINREGEPMTGYVVTPCVFQYVGGRRVLVEATGSPETDDAGDYRIRPLPPGRYYILVKKQPYRGGPDSEQDRSATPRQEDYVATYYPGTADPAGAVPVEVAAGQTASGVNITLVRAHVTRVRGRLVNQTAARVSLALRPAGIAEMWGVQANPGPGPSNPQGRTARALAGCLLPQRPH
ncbi:MAG: carboxypeptidase-like regulatory domain-containing protein [Acidobacteriia bacterium]|nr:carboxypeptidase-like regulatory domain-containing protein [Terriglobia bacterium]